MAIIADRNTAVVLDTSEVADSDVVTYWRDALSSTIVPLVAEPLGNGCFKARLEHNICGPITFTTVAASGKTVRRTKRLVAQSDTDSILVSVQLNGSGMLEQDGRTAVMTEGSIVFCDSSHPYSLYFPDAHAHLVIQVAKSDVHFKNIRELTARTFGVNTPGAPVAAFLSSLSASVHADPFGSAVLVPHAISLISAVAAFVSSPTLDMDAVEALTRQRVSDFLRQNYADAQLGADDVARYCNMSRRSLYRIAGSGGVVSQLRRIRVEQAKILLIRDPERPVAAIAVACGFESESGFHRAFKQVTAETPGRFRLKRTDVLR